MFHELKWPFLSLKCKQDKSAFSYPRSLPVNSWDLHFTASWNILLEICMDDKKFFSILVNPRTNTNMLDGRHPGNNDSHTWDQFITLLHYIAITWYFRNQVLLYTLFLLKNWFQKFSQTYYVLIKSLIM